jgi:FkbM family methyltransferase
MTTSADTATRHSVTTPRGYTAQLWCRPGTIDLSLAIGVLTEDEYHVKEVGLPPLSGHMLDVGGYIGFVGIAMALENPDLAVTIVEPIPDNVALIGRNIVANGLESRVSVLELAAGTDADMLLTYGYQHVDGEPDGYVQDSRYVGNLYAPGSHPMTADTCVVQGASLRTLFERIALDDDGRLALLKVDCEGCEWQLLDSPLVDRIDRIFGEWHGNPGLDGLRDLLPNHYVIQVDENPVNGIFWATSRG